MSGEFDSASPSSHSFSQSDYHSVSSEMQAEPNMETSLQEKRTDREIRHVGSIISDNVRNSQSVKTVKRTYQIGQNTGESLRNNIAKFRLYHYYILQLLYIRYIFYNSKQKRRGLSPLISS
ncbi:hypothetical protein CHI08_13340 [Peribacillus simplex]|nr:hypothetical protein CHI08_13340 [Peribacillus simplex]